MRPCVSLRTSWEGEAFPAGPRQRRLLREAKGGKKATDVDDAFTSFTCACCRLWADRVSISSVQTRGIAGSMWRAKLRRRLCCSDAARHASPELYKLRSTMQLLTAKIRRVSRWTGLLTAPGCMCSLCSCTEGAAQLTKQELCGSSLAGISVFQTTPVISDVRLGWGLLQGAV